MRLFERALQMVGSCLELHRGTYAALTPFHYFQVYPANFKERMPSHDLPNSLFRATGTVVALPLQGPPPHPVPPPHNNRKSPAQANATSPPQETRLELLQIRQIKQHGPFRSAFPAPYTTFALETTGADTRALAATHRPGSSYHETAARPIGRGSDPRT